MKRRLVDAGLYALVGLALVLFVAGCLLVWLKAPCELWALTKAGEAPIRCVR